MADNNQTEKPAVPEAMPDWVKAINKDFPKVERITREMIEAVATQLTILAGAGH